MRPPTPSLLLAAPSLADHGDLALFVVALAAVLALLVLAADHLIPRGRP